MRKIKVYVRVTEAVDEWLLAVTIPSGVLVATGIPHNLVHDLRDKISDAPKEL
jgi:hypothetical protein